MQPKFEDKTVISRFVINSFDPDKPKFIERFTRYEDPFKTTAIALIVECENIVATSFYLTQSKTVTSLLITTAISVRTDLDDFEIYAINAGVALNISWKDMGIKAVRDCISRKNMEGIAPAMTVLNANITANEDALTDQGMTQAKWDGLLAKVEQVRLLNEKQNKMEGDKEEAVAANHQKFDDMWAVTMNICRAGKAIFKGQVRANEYTIATLLKRIRHDGSSPDAIAQRKAEQMAAMIGEWNLTVKDFGLVDSWVEDAEVEIVGTDYKLPTDDEGKLLVDLKEGTYNVIIRRATYEDVVISIVIKAGETTTTVVELKGLE